jgi:endoribonuclease Dicer
VPGWHSLLNRPASIQLGPYGSKVSLPRTLPARLRVFETKTVHPTKTSAHRHAAFMAYKALYKEGLLNDQLLPLFMDDSEIEELKQDVEKWRGMSEVSRPSLDPWAPSAFSPPARDDGWYSCELQIGNYPPLLMFTRPRPIEWTDGSQPTLYVPNTGELRVSLSSVIKVEVPSSVHQIEQARVYTKELLWNVHGSRLTKDNVQFSYLFLPKASEPPDSIWNARRRWLDEVEPDRHADDTYNANAARFGRQFSYPDDLYMVRDGFRFSKAYRFVRWRYEELTTEEEEPIKKRYAHFLPFNISYPILVVKPFHPRRNFLLPSSGESEDGKQADRILLPQFSAVVLQSRHEVEHAFLLPSVLRAQTMDLTVQSLKDTLFASPELKQLYEIPFSLMKTAILAPAAGEPQNYQRLEALGDAVLKFVSSVQLFAEHENWHEGYLSRKKDHSVANIRLANENIKRKLFLWIIKGEVLLR